MILAVSCKTPPVPPEASRADALEEEIGKAGGLFFAPEAVEAYHRELVDLKTRLASEKAKFGWFRNYDGLRGSYRKLVGEGDAILVRIAAAKNSRSDAFAGAAQELAARVGGLKRITRFFNENDEIRRNATQADIKLAEARLLAEKEKYADAQAAVSSGMDFVEKALAAATTLLARYLDPGQLGRWKALADETIAASRTKGTVAIVVNKIERVLTVYRRGEIAAVFEVGLGKFGLSDKLFAGDEATPEGHYRIVKKFPNSTFYKALLIDYPNDSDRREFAAARRNGTVPEKATIGGAIEIHGGGKDNLTMGCIGLENKDMDEVFRWAEVGTPVTIVGATSLENTVLADIRKLINHEIP